LSAKQAEITELAMGDTLTGLANRRHLLLPLEHSMALSKREGSVLVLMMIDLDGFKSINDQFGHASEDAVLTVDVCVSASIGVAFSPEMQR
jgi:diguanylate cyclase (GGDEF)-like protein